MAEAPGYEDLSIVIPAYNEGERIEKVISSYIDFFPGCEIIVVSNGSTDGTVEAVKRFAGVREEVRLLVYQERIGKGGAILEGFKESERDLMGFVDADESTSPEDFQKLLDEVARSGVDGAIASRRIKGARITVKQTLRRRISSRAFNVLVRIMFGLDFRDTQCGAKVFKKGCIKAVLPLMKTAGFEFDVEILWRLKKNGCRVREVPITWAHSEGSTFSLKHAPSMFWNLLKVRLT